jgi:hypothetical protein
VVLVCIPACDCAAESDAAALCAALEEAMDETRCVAVADIGAPRDFDVVAEVDAAPDSDGCADCDGDPLLLRDVAEESDGFALSDAETDCECDTVGLDAPDSDPLWEAVNVADEERESSCVVLPDGDGVDDVDALSDATAEVLAADVAVAEL